MSALRPALLRWVASRGRWVNRVVLVASIGAIFVAFPNATMDFLGVQRSVETAVLFRLYGIALLSRAVDHHGPFGIPDPRAVRCGILSDLVFSTMSLAVLVWAMLNDLAGPGTWLPVGLFAVETSGYLIAYVGLHTVTREELLEAPATVTSSAVAPSA
jgi:hypothetical protein